MNSPFIVIEGKKSDPFSKILKICLKVAFAFVLCFYILFLASSLITFENWSGGLEAMEFVDVGNFSEVEKWLIDQKNKIMMIETTPGEFCPYLRQSCAVESVARQNPNVTVVFFLRASSIASNCTILDTLESIPNVKIIFYTLDEIFNGTPLLKWSHTLNEASTNPAYLKAHMSDALRMALVYKYSGIYMDLDFIVLRPLDELLRHKNFMVKQSISRLSNGMLGFRSHNSFMQKAIKEFATTYNGRSWAANGPDLLVRVASQMGCDISRSNTCQGIQLVNPASIYPIHYYNVSSIFENTGGALADRFLNDNTTLTVHLWNYLSHMIKSPVAAKNVINICGQAKCPSTFDIASNMPNHEF